MPTLLLISALLALAASPGASAAPVAPEVRGAKATGNDMAGEVQEVALPEPPTGMHLLSLEEQRARVEAAQTQVPRVRHPRHFDVAPFAAASGIPIELAPSVADALAHYQGPGRAGMRTLMRRLTRYLPLMQPVLTEHDVPLELVALAMIESGLTTHAVSHADAAGPWQFIPSTGLAYGLAQTFWIDERRDPVRSTDAAARFLKELHARFGHWYLAFAGYNAGGARVGRAIEASGTRDFWKLRHRLAIETQDYVPRIIAVALIARHPAAFGFTHQEFAYLEPLAFEEAALSDQVALAFAARATGSTVEHLRALNPELLRWLTPPASKTAPYRLRVPPGTARRLNARIQQAPRTQRLNAKLHRVRRGDSLLRIARRYDTHPQAIRDANRLTSDRHLRLNARIAVPVPPKQRRPARASVTAARTPRKAAPHATARSPKRQARHGR